MKVLITQAEYARSRKARGLPGGTAPAVWRAVHTKRIELVDGLIDPEQADQDWERRTDHRQRRRARENIRPDGASAEPKIEKSDGNFQEAQRQREWERVKRERLARRKEEGELIEVALVESHWSDITGRFQSAVLGLPAQMANRLPAEWRREVLAVAADEARRALVALSNEIRADKRAA